MTNETEFIQKLRHRFNQSLPDQIAVGIGDDGAVLNVQEESQQIVVTDMLLDGVHFDLTTTSLRLAGRKAVAVNLSDLAAMGCRPVAGFVSIAVPKSLSVGSEEFLDQLYEGIADISQQYGLSIAGGDTNSWTGPFAINVCLTGTPTAAQPVLRSTAQPGDRLFVTGPLGGSLNKGRHLTFEPRLKLAEQLVATSAIHAMMDISDGLALDLSRLMTASNCGATINAATIPIHDDVDSSLPLDDRLQHALSDGEDFELLIACAAESIAALQSHLSAKQLIEIGVVTESPDLTIVDSSGKPSTLIANGFQHLSR